MNNHSRSRNKGFTLIEVLIAMVILTFISIITYRAINQTYRIRDVLVHEGEFYNSIRVALSIVGRDIQMAYSPFTYVQNPKANTTPVPEDANALRELAERAPSIFWLPPTSSLGVRLSRFIGSSNSLSFVSVSNSRIYRDSPASIFGKVSYTLKRKAGFGNEESSFQLIRSINPKAFEADQNPDREAKNAILLEGIEKLVFRFSKTGEKQDWIPEWDSEKADYKQDLPKVIEATLIVNGPSRLKFEGTYLFRTEIPKSGLKARF